MAKRRLSDAPSPATPSVATPPLRLVDLARPVAIAMLAGAWVYAAYHPSDSTAVDQGDGLWFSMLGLATATVAVLAKRRVQVTNWPDRIVTFGPWAIATWVFIAAFVGGDAGGLRAATNEAWMWFAGAAVFTASRMLLIDAPERRAMVTLGLAIAAGLAAHGLYQNYVSLPETIEAYRTDPDRIIAMAGIDAPAGTAQRMRFENRLFDGGPTATFALANSLAAVVLVGVVLAAGWLRQTFPRDAWWVRVTATVVMLLCGTGVLVTRSRAATLAMLIGVAAVWIASIPAIRRSGRKLAMALAGFVAASTLAGILIAALGKREWFEQAPVSLSFRFQYWRSTWRMVRDHPWFGSGPGNFQSVYERYREPQTTEQISDPHNFLFETMASGGLPAALMLIALLIACGWLVYRRSGVDAETSSTASKWIAGGSLVALSLVWLFGWAGRSLPDTDASPYVLAVMAVTTFVAWRSLQSMPGRLVDLIAAIACGVALLHLTVSGGWTVPGVMMPVWIFGGMVTRMSIADTDGDSAAKRWLPVGFGLVLMMSLYLVSLRPVQQQRRLLAIAESAQLSGQIGKARMTLEQAVDADPWSVAAALWLADHYRYQLLAGNDSDPQLRRQWNEAAAQAKRLAGSNPTVLTQIGAGQLHAYQRFGRADDLAAASETFDRVASLGPSNQWVMAQLSEIRREQNDVDASREFASRAETLSKLGNNIERALYLQSIYVAKPIGQTAQRQPVRESAKALLDLPSRSDGMQ